MRFALTVLVGSVLGVAAGLAQPPESRPPTVQNIDPAALRLKVESGRWQLWSGDALIQDFGRNDADARAALALLRALRVTSRCQVGVFDYFLSDGAAPSSPIRSKTIVPFDAENLTVECRDGRWLLRDGRQTLYDFGPAQADARSALAVCRQHGFNQIALVGQPMPSLRIPIRDPQPAFAMSPASPIRPVSATINLAAPSEKPLAIRGLGVLERTISFDYRRVDVQRDGDGWTLLAGPTVLGRFGRREIEARQTAALLQDFRCTAICRFGERGFGFCLSHGQAPTGPQVGVAFRALHAERLTIRSDGGTWSICEDARPLFAIGADESAARQALAAIQHFRFNAFMPLGAGRMGPVYLLARNP